MRQIRLRPMLGSCVRRLVPLSIVLAMLVAAMPARVAHADTPPPTEDQFFTTPTDASLTLTAPPWMYIAQTFTVGVTGALHTISLDLASATYGGEMQIALRGVTNGVPNASMLAYVLLTEDDLRAMAVAPLSYMIPMPDLFVTAGEQYAIEVNYISYSNMDPPPTAVWHGASGDLYPGGAVFTGSDGTYTDWQPASDPRLDLHFRTFVITGVPISDLTVTRVRGADKASACRQFSEIYTVTNNGPDTAEHVMLNIGITDQFDRVSLEKFPGGGSGPFTLAPGESVQLKAVIKVTAFVPGEDRAGRVGATAYNDSWPDFTIDPKPDNDTLESIVWLQGQPRTVCK